MLSNEAKGLLKYIKFLVFLPIIMKITYLTNNMDPKNGWGRYASDLISGVKGAGHDVIILKEEDDGKDGTAILKRGPGMFVSAIKIKKYLKSCDIIHALDVYPCGIIAYLANMFLRKKLIITAQGTYSVAPFYNIKTKYLASMACHSADVIVAISNYTKKALLKRVNIKKVEVINHGVDLPKFYRERQTSDEPYILSVGALKFRKGYHISIPAFLLAKEKFPDLKYKIVGSQKDRNYFEKLQGAQGVEFLTDLTDERLGELYSGAKLFILTSVNEGYHFEGFGLVFLEASAAGLPVIGTFGNGIEDAVSDGYNGILVPQNGIEKTAEALLETLQNQEKWQEMSVASYQWARQHDLPKVINKYLDVYNQVLV